MHRLWILPLLCSLPLHAAEPTIHKWVDDKGVVHFSDRLSEGVESEQLNMSVVNTSTGSQTPEATPADKATTDAALTAIESYRLTVTSPANGETLRENSGLVKVVASVTPQPTAPYVMKVLLDGQELGSYDNTLSAELTNVERGMHQLEVQVQDESGKILASSTTVTFYLFRVSTLTAPKAKPKPKAG